MVLSHYATQLVNIEELSTHFFEILSCELQVLLVHMITASKKFNNVTDFGKKSERVRQECRPSHYLIGQRIRAIIVVLCNTLEIVKV